MRRIARQAELEAAYETPIERYAREGLLVNGCMYGAKFQTTTGTLHGAVKKDENGNPIMLFKCNKVVDPGERFCPRHKMLDQVKKEKSGAYMPRLSGV